MEDAADKRFQRDLEIEKLPQHRTSFIFKVQAVSDIGSGVESKNSDPIYFPYTCAKKSSSKDWNSNLPSKPGKPRALNVLGDSIELEWTKPKEGAHNITSYTVFYRSTSDPPDQWKEKKSKTSKERIVFSQMSEKTTYLFKVQPECEAGVGLESDISEPIMTNMICLLYTSPSPRDATLSRMPSSA